MLLDLHLNLLTKFLHVEVCLQGKYLDNIGNFQNQTNHVAFLLLPDCIIRT